MPTASSSSASLTVSGGANRSVVGVTALEISPSRATAPCTTVCASMPSIELGAEQQARPADRRRPAGCLEQLGEAAALLRAPAPGASMRRISSMTALDRRGGERGAAVRAAVVAGLEHRRDLALGPAGADGHAVADRLGQRDDVGHDAVCSKPNHLPVRPKPVWISSTIISAPTSSHSCADAARGSRAAPG